MQSPCKEPLRAGASDATSGRSTDKRDALRGWGWWALVLLAAFGLRVAFALHKGLVLDEFHTLHHASADSLSGLMGGLLRDNHPPLTFLIVRLFLKTLGSGELFLRLPAILASVSELLLLVLIVRRHRNLNPIAPVLLVALSTAHLDYSTQIRMYAMHALAVTAATFGLLEVYRGATVRARRVGCAVLALAVGFGLHNHYFFAHYLIGAGLFVGGWVIFRRTGWTRLVPAVGAAVLGVLAFVPWLLTGFRTQLSHQLAPGGDDVGLLALIESFVHLFFLNISFGGEAGSIAFGVVGLVTALLACLGTWQLVRRGDGFTAGLLLTTGFLVPIYTNLLATYYPRSGYTWSYVLPSTAAVGLLVGAACGTGLAERGERWARRACGLSVAAALLLCGLQFRHPGTEDYPGAIQQILEGYRPGDGVISAEMQPSLFPAGMPWDYYAPRLSEQPPPRLAVEGLSLVDPTALRGLGRLWILSSKLQFESPLRQQIGAAGYRRSQAWNHGYGRDVVLFESNGE